MKRKSDKDNNWQRMGNGWFILPSRKHQKTGVAQ